MNAKYFYNWLLGYDKESKRTNTSYHGYKNGYVCIHHNGDNQKWFRINKDGTVHEQSVYKTYGTFHINNMKGDDYELFSTSRIVQSDYILLGELVSESNVKNVITELHRLIKTHETVYMSDGTAITPSPRLRGNYTVPVNGIKSKFAYCSSNGIEVHIQTIRELDKENINRKHYGANIIPISTSKGIKKTNAIHITFIHNMTNESIDSVLDRTNESFLQLLAYIEKAGVDKCGTLTTYTMAHSESPIYY